MAETRENLWAGAWGWKVGMKAAKRARLKAAATVERTG